MRLIIEIVETKGGDMAVRLRREAGLGTDLEQAYADAILDHVKSNIPAIGRRLGGKGLLGGEPEKQ